MENWIIGERISRDNNYNILRIMAAMAVMYGHMYCWDWERPSYMLMKLIVWDLKF